MIIFQYYFVSFVLQAHDDNSVYNYSIIDQNTKRILKKVRYISKLKNYYIVNFEILIYNLEYNQ